MDHICKNRYKEMAAMRGYANLLNEIGNSVMLNTVTAIGMKEIRLKSARFTFSQYVKYRSLSDEERFNQDTVDWSDIDNEKLYYSGFLFSPSIVV